VIALNTDDGRSLPAALLYFGIAWGDQLDGLAARLTGQYSRLGALLDPLTDRALVLAGAIVCWNFELLPRWALAVLAVREAGMIVLVRYGLRHGADIKINWPGRWSVWPLMSALFFALAGVEWLAYANLYVGLLLALWATALYLKDGRRQLSTRG